MIKLQPTQDITEIDPGKRYVVEIDGEGFDDDTVVKAMETLSSHFCAMGMAGKVVVVLKDTISIYELEAGDDDNILS